MSNRDECLRDPFARVEVDADRIIPEYLLREATADEGWEDDFKDGLEINGLASQFAQKFLESYKVENHQTVQTWEPDKAATWLKSKALKDGEYDHVRARKILEESGAIDEKRTEVIELLEIELKDTEEKPDKESPTSEFKDEKTPKTVSEVELEKNEQAAEDLKKKSVAGYGLVLSSVSLHLYKEGSKLAEMDVEMAGGFDVMAEELDYIETEKDVLALFNLRDEVDEVAKVGWLTTKAVGPLVDGPDLERGSHMRGEDGEFDPAGVEQSNSERDSFTADPGPASAVPGSKAIARGVPTDTGEGSSVTT